MPISRGDFKLLTVCVSQHVVDILVSDFLRPHVDHHAVSQLGQHQVVQELSLMPRSECLGGLELQHAAQRDQYVEEVVLLTGNYTVLFYTMKVVYKSKKLMVK